MSDSKKNMVEIATSATQVTVCIGIETDNQGKKQKGRTGQKCSRALESNTKKLDFMFMRAHFLSYTEYIIDYVSPLLCSACVTIK